MLKKAMALLLCALTVFPCFIACADKQQPDTPDAAVEGTETTLSESTDENAETSATLDIPMTNYNGETFTVLTGIDEKYVMRRFASEELTGEAINDSFYNRNLKVEDMLGIDLVQVVNTSSTLNAFKNSVTAGDEAYDVAFFNFADSTSAISSQCCVDIASLPYVNLEKPWWNADSVNQLKLLGKNYLVASDITIGDKDVMWVLFFDKQHLEDMQLENPYELVANNKWTFDKFYEMIQGGLYDINGDSAYDMKDRYGLLTHDENYAGLWMSAGESLFKLDENYYPYMSWNTDRFAQVWDKISMIMGSEATYGKNIDFISSGLREGQALFATEVVAFIRMYRENEREFGILPMPKFDEAQERYYTYVAVNSLLMVAAKGLANPERTGEVLEALAAKGREIILPAYYEVSLKSKYSRDEQSSKSLDIIFENRMYDIGVVFGWGGIAAQLKKSDVNLASTYEKVQKSANKTMNKLLEKMAEDDA